MALTEEERRRYFRIEDTVGVAWEVVSGREAVQRQEEMSREDYSAPGRLYQVEKQLQVLIDKLRIQNPEFAEALELLNVKFSSLKEKQTAERGYRSNSDIKKVSISACGISFTDSERMAPGTKLALDLTLLPTDLHVHTIGEVIDCLEGEKVGDWIHRIDFCGMRSEDEELMVQHIVKRQGKLIKAQRENENKNT